MLDRRPEALPPCWYVGRLLTSCSQQRGGQGRIARRGSEGGQTGTPYTRSACTEQTPSAGMLVMQREGRHLAPCRPSCSVNM